MMIEKIQICDGLFYVSIPQADLYIQCGAPAESVKHLIKNKIITKTTKNGVVFETGPNAILLSDIMIQNGDFSNLAEFPVLQMLYKQGRIIPNHPNNDGSKPLLIGQREQLEAQLEYIYRGNYGLITQEELDDCLDNKSLSNALFEMKLKFAFGKLAKTQELLESYILESDYITPIKNGVYIQRVAPNLFNIHYGEEKIQVDLNLKTNQFYKSSYILPKTKIDWEDFSIVHTGQGDGWDTQNPSTHSVIVHNGKVYLIDVVPNIRYILDSMSLDVNEIDGVFLTHAHDDHLAGITYLIRSDKKVTIYGVPMVLESMAKKISALINIDQERFLQYIDAQELVLQQYNNIDGLEVLPMLSAHPIETTIFAFQAKDQNGTIKSYAHLMDICTLDTLEKLKLNEQLSNQIKLNYTYEADIKKIDVGGGMIHGDSIDFINDKSKKIILSHTADLDPQHKIPFGTQDVLIKASKDYNKLLVEKFLRKNFKSIKQEDIEQFQKFEVVTYKPNTRFLHEGKLVYDIYLLLSGKIILEDTSLNNIVVLTAGAMVGEYLVLEHRVSNYNICSKNYITALKIPENFFRDFVTQNNLLEEIEFKVFHRHILHKVSLFNEEISYSNLNKIAESIQSIRLCNEEIVIDTSKVYLIVTGHVEVYQENQKIDTLKAGDHFGGIVSVLGFDSRYKYKASDKALIYTVDADTLKNIPIVRWKILEYFERLNR
ncbi:MAG: cyclic nucleotide-binding domain-containing protein [Campylobacterales bacterium]|nr:cyclic nucleotide-binding domain-containing protein [Campylobacterales bacterium]